jgi:hypothetical protein
MVLLINAELVNPPTSLQCFRTLTLISKLYCSFDVLLETDQDKDLYFKFLKKRGYMDYIDDIVFLGEEIGLRIDNDYRFSPCFVTDRIDVQTLSPILDFIGFKASNLKEKDKENELTCLWCRAKYSHTIEKNENVGEFVIKKIVKVFECFSTNEPHQSTDCKQASYGQYNA